MTTLDEKELLFTFPTGWHVERFDDVGRVWPRHVAPVDFVVERPDDVLLIEVKDPSNSRAPDGERAKFVKKMESDELTHQELAPKARTSWSYLHLMDRTAKPLRFVVVIGVDALSVQPVLLQHLGDRLKRRLAQEAEQPWVRPYVVSSVVLPALEVSKFLPGVEVTRKLAAK